MNIIGIPYGSDLNIRRMDPFELSTERPDPVVPGLEASLAVLNREMNSVFGEIDQMSARVKAFLIDRGVLDRQMNRNSLDPCQLAAIAARVIADQVSPLHHDRDFYGSLLDHAAQLISQRLPVSSEEAMRIISIQLATIAARALRS